MRIVPGDSHSADPAIVTFKEHRGWNFDLTGFMSRSTLQDIGQQATADDSGLDPAGLQRSQLFSKLNLRAYDKHHEGHMRIHEYFQRKGIDRALKHYPIFAAEHNWKFDDHLIFYRQAADAFEPLNGQLDMRKRRRAFDFIYDGLKARWQVFRRAQGYWTAQQVFDTLTLNPACQACGHAQALSLLTLDNNASRKAVAACLSAVKEIKVLSSGQTSAMTICKFLHFFNPSLFPIYDDWAIHQKVLTTFKNDWQGFRARVDDTDIDVVYRYVLWASTIMHTADTSLMPTFVNWFEQRIKPKGLPPG